jgi:hypothetical protein
MTGRRTDNALQLALTLAGNGWHVFPLSPRKQPLKNCADCPSNIHPRQECPCIPAGRTCHGPWAATTNPDLLAYWWTLHPHAIPGIAAGPSGLVLIDLDTHTDEQPADPATALLPGIDLNTECIPAPRLATVRNGRDSLLLLAELRGGPRPWPTGPDHQPIVAASPSGGGHLWYREPAGVVLRQAIGELGWQIDIKAGWSYGIAPGATSARGTYTITAGDPARPGDMPDWLLREVVRTASRKEPRKPRPLPVRRTGRPGPASYLATVIERGASELVSLHDGRKRALAALAYKTGGFLDWAGLTPHQIEAQLITAGTDSGLPERLAHRIVTRSLANGLAAPLPGPASQTDRSQRTG